MKEKLYKKFLIRNMPAGLHSKLKQEAAKRSVSMELLAVEAIKKELGVK